MASKEFDRQRCVVVSAWRRYAVGSRRWTTKLLSGSVGMQTMLWKLARHLVGIKPVDKVPYRTDHLPRVVALLADFAEQATPYQDQYGKPSTMPTRPRRVDSRARTYRFPS